jgi:hypothetical protein
VSSLRLGVVIAASFQALGFAPADGGQQPILLTADQEATTPRVKDGSADAKPEVRFQSVRILDRDGTIVSSEDKGALTLDDWQRAARPWTRLDEAYLYHDQAWQRVLAGGRIEQGYRVVRTPNRAIGSRRSAPVKAELGPTLTRLAGGIRPVEVILALKDYPSWDIPLVASSRFLSDADRESGLAMRAAALQARKASFDVHASGVLAHLARLGGEVIGRGWGGGWIMARVPPSALRALASRADVARIDAVSGVAEQAQAEHDSAGEATVPGPGSFNLGETRHGTRVDANRFLAAGLTGETPNPDRHSAGDIVIGVNELRLMEDEACFLADGDGCGSKSRLRERFECNGAIPGDRCQEVTDLSDIDEPGSSAAPFLCCAVSSDCSADGTWTCSLGVPGGLCPSTRACECVASTCARHGTGVASIAQADYTGGQGDDFAVGDDACPGGCIHDDTFKNRATGIAPEASLVFWGRHEPGPQSEDSLAAAFTSAIEHHVDILNNSWTWRGGGTDCNPLAIRAFEKEAENAYDDGIFVVAAAGNHPDGVLGSCDVGSPADIPKVFAVNGLRTSALGCGSNYKACVVTPDSAATGGATLTTPDGVAHLGALSVIAMDAPTGIRYVTTERGDFGEVDERVAFGGSSGATAVVSGAAALVKSHYLRRGDSWINAPGRLYTVMLAMGDRHFGATAAQLVTGSSADWGFGRIKLRKLGATDPGGRDAFMTHTASVASPVDWVPFATPLDADTKLVKCVLLQEEDMSGQEFVSNVDLRVEVREPTAGACGNPGAVLSSREDTSFDIKSMVAFTSTEAALGGKCVNVVASPLQIVPPAVTSHVMCYASSIADDAQLPDTDGDDLPDVDEITRGTSPTVADTDGDGITDGMEVYERRTSPILADTDGDGVPDGVDLITFDHCTTSRLGVPIFAAMASTVTRPPTFEWQNAADTDGVRLDICADSACRDVSQTFDVVGTSLALAGGLAQGTEHHWRAFAEVGADVGCRPSETSAFTLDEPPMLALPADIFAEASGAGGTVVTYSAAATDVVDGTAAVACIPASGSTFAPGATSVSCSATDSHGSTVSGAFTVTVTFSWSGILPPIDADGTSIFRLGKKVRVSFALTGASAGIADGVFALHVGTETHVFRYDSEDGRYSLKLDTDGLSAGTWPLRIDLGDGVPHVVPIALREKD